MKNSALETKGAMRSDSDPLKAVSVFTPSRTLHENPVCANMLMLHFLAQFVT